MEAWIGVIIGILGIAVMVMLFLYPRREKVEIKIETPDYVVDRVERKLTVYLGYKLHRSGGKEIRYTKQIQLKPDKQKYNELRHYFTLPPSGKIPINDRLKLQRDDIVSPYQGGAQPDRPVYQALPELPRNTEQRDKSQQVASELSQLKCKVRLVWEDGGKTKWKTISKENHGKWVRM